MEYENEELARLQAAAMGLLEAARLVVQHHPAGASVVAHWAHEASSALGRHVKPDKPADGTPTEPSAKGEGSP